MVQTAEKLVVPRCLCASDLRFARPVVSFFAVFQHLLCHFSLQLSHLQFELCVLPDVGIEKLDDFIVAFFSPIFEEDVELDEFLLNLG